MKKIIIGLFLLSFLSLSFSGIAHAAVFSPTPLDVMDLDHHHYYAWEINWTPQGNYEIESVTLKINGITDWTTEPDDALYMHLMDSVSGGTKLAGSNIYSWYDNQGGGDAWAGTPLIAVYSDNTNPWYIKENLVYNFGSSLIDDLANFSGNDSTFYIGFDPDCHYYNQNITLEIITKHVPEPGTLVLFGSGLLGLAFVARRRSN